MGHLNISIRQTARETIEIILSGTPPQVEIGDFLDDWRRLPMEGRAALVREPIADVGDDRERMRWAAFIAAPCQ